MRVTRSAGTIAQRLARSAVGRHVLALDTRTLIDARLYDFVTAQPRDLAVEDGEAAIAWVADPAALAADAQDLRSAIAPALPRLTQAEFPGFIRNLRRTLPFYLFRVTNAAERAKVERFLFWSNYKGSTDFFTKYVYPPLVWVMVRPLARAHVHPNWVTIISIVLTFVGGVFYGAAGYLLLGLALWLGAKAVGVDPPFKIARQLVAFAALPLALSLVVLVPAIVLGFGEDWFRTGGSDEGTGRAVVTALGLGFVAWSTVLVALGLRTTLRLPWRGVAGSLALAGVMVAAFAVLPSVL